MEPRVKVALASVGLGRVQRGFERWANDLFEVLGASDCIDPTLFRSRGAVPPRQMIPPLLWPATRVVRSLPIGRIAGAEEYKRDCIAFAACMIPSLLRRRFDVVHVVDPPLAVALSRLRRVVPFQGRLLFTDGSAIPPEFYPAADHLHHVAFSTWEAAVRAGIAESRMSLVPSGLRTERFLPAGNRSALRQAYGVDKKTFVVLVVSALKRDHKRVDHAIREVGRLEGDVLLWLDGNPEDPEIPALARELLGEKCRISHVSSADVPDLYRMADVLVHPSVTEAFGLTVVEALCSGLPALIHDAPHFRWLAEGAAEWIDMTAAGAVAARLNEFRRNRGAIAERSRDAAVAIRERYEWRNLKYDYERMYRTVAAARTNGSRLGVERPLLASRRAGSNGR